MKYSLGTRVFSKETGGLPSQGAARRFSFMTDGAQVTLRLSRCRTMTPGAGEGLGNSGWRIGVGDGIARSLSGRRVPAEGRMKMRVDVSADVYAWTRRRSRVETTVLEKRFPKLSDEQLSGVRTAFATDEALLNRRRPADWTDTRRQPRPYEHRRTSRRSSRTFEGRSRACGLHVARQCERDCVTRARSEPD